MKTEPMKETTMKTEPKTAETLLLESTILIIEMQSESIRHLASYEAGYENMTAAALLQEQSDALLAVVERLKEVL